VVGFVVAIIIMSINLVMLGRITYVCRQARGRENNLVSLSEPRIFSRPFSRTSGMERLPKRWVHISCRISAGRRLRRGDESWGFI
jgi:hypothetical protein